MIEGITIKAFPGMDTTQAAEQAAIAVASQLAEKSPGLPADEIESVEMRVNDHPMTLGQISTPERRAPASRETADHSFHYLVAVGLLDAEITPRQFSHDRWLEPAVVDLMRRIAIEPSSALTDAYPGGFPCSLTVKMRDGRIASSEVGFARGHARNKMSCSEVEAKFNRLTMPLLNNDRAERIVATVRRLEALTNITELASLLGAPPTAC